MNRPRVSLALLGIGIAACASTRTEDPNLVWHDEFDGPAGSAVDTAKWIHDTGGSGWGNQERERYTPGNANAALDGGGNLVITAVAESAPTRDHCWYGPCRYTSARIKTQTRFSQAYGRFEARIKIPRGQGLWPAFWMLGADISGVGWPQSGEIDVMENIGKEPAIVHGTMHGPGYSGGNGIGRADTLASGALADGFHVYAVDWRPDTVRWYMDGALYHQVTPANLPTGTQWVFGHPFFLLLNVAVGGGWPGDPDATTTFPQTMVVDYVRVYRH